MVDWSLARQIARFAAGGGAPTVLEADFPALVAENEPHLRDYTGLELAQPMPAPEAVDRAEWADLNPGAAGGLPSFPEPSRIVEEFREGGLMAIVQTHEQRRLMKRVQATMAVVEGYSEHVMDVLGERVLPAYAGLREAMERRRRSRSYPERILQRLLGMDMKLRQYELGKAFCDAVVERAGIESLNRVWESPGTLPSTGELRHP